MQCYISFILLQVKIHKGMTIASIFWELIGRNCVNDFIDFANHILLDKNNKISSQIQTTSHVESALTE